jgi:hypothetical protein
MGGAVCHVLLEEGGGLLLESLNRQGDFPKLLFCMVYFGAQVANRLTH